MLDPKIFTMTFLFDFFGRDPNLTGRISLWEIGIEAVRERLVLGWSFDSQRSVMSTQFKIGYGQFHNGYIDLFVAGGLIGFGIFAYMIIIFIKRSMVLNSSTKFSNIAFAVTLLIHNFSEASIIHSVNYLWFVFTLLFVFSSHEYGIIKRERYK
jgi:O-antigen ligase